MASLSFIIGIIGNVISILMFASPMKRRPSFVVKKIGRSFMRERKIFVASHILAKQKKKTRTKVFKSKNTFKQVVKKKSTENYKGVPYITTLLSTSLWTFYGVLKTDGLLVVTVNGVGAGLNLLYVILFLIYSPKHTKVKSVKLVGIVNVGFLGGVIIVTMVGLRGGIRLTLVGVLCALITVGMYAAPLSAMRTVIKMKSVKYMPFFLSFFQFLNGAVWSAYAVLIKDYYIGVPNGIGLLLGSAQLILYMMYKNESNCEEKMEEEGSANLFKMQDFNEEDSTNMKSTSLYKGNSLPIPSLAREYNQKIIKTISLTPFELEKLNEKDIEKGF